jgi:hypothetical protein
MLKFSSLKKVLSGKAKSGDLVKFNNLNAQVRKALGITNLPVVSSQRVVRRKAKSLKHFLTDDEILQANEILKKPLAIFKFSKKTSSKNVIGSYRQGNKILLIGIDLEILKEEVRIHEITTFFLKDISKIKIWLKEGIHKLEWVGNKKDFAKIFHIPAPIASVEDFNQSLSPNLLPKKKIVKKKNPTERIAKINENGKLELCVKISKGTRKDIETLQNSLEKQIKRLGLETSISQERKGKSVKRVFKNPTNNFYIEFGNQIVRKMNGE